jgi:putative membrane protein
MGDMEPGFRFGPCTRTCGLAGAYGQGPQEEGRQMFLYGPHLGGWGWALGLGSLVFWALVAAAIIIALVLFARGGQRPQPPSQDYASGTGPYSQPGPAPGHAAAPEQILAERFARGEIDEDEFHQRLATLRAAAPHPGPTATPR